MTASISINPPADILKRSAVNREGGEHPPNTSAHAPTAQSPAGYLQPAGLHMVGVSAIPRRGALARRYAAQNKQLGYRVSIVSNLKKVMHCKGLRGDSEKLGYR